MKFCLMLLSLLGLGVKGSPGRSTDTIVQVAEKGGLTTLVDLLKITGLDAALSGEGPFTVFAPTDAAFAKLPLSTVNELKANPDLASGILLYHVSPKKINSGQIMDGMAVETLAGSPLVTSVQGHHHQMVTVDGSNVITRDIQASNGVIHLVDSVLLPASDDLATVISSDPDLSTLWTAIQTAGLAEVFMGKDQLTLFAPVNAAFERLPPGALEGLVATPADLAALLQGHVAPGRLFSAGLPGAFVSTLQDKVMVGRDALGRQAVSNMRGTAQLLVTDVKATNGVLHKIGDVLP